MILHPLFKNAACANSPAPDAHLPTTLTDSFAPYRSTCLDAPAPRQDEPVAIKTASASCAANPRPTASRIIRRIGEIPPCRRASSPNVQHTSPQAKYRLPILVCVCVDQHPSTPHRLRTARDHRPHVQQPPTPTPLQHRIPITQPTAPASASAASQTPSSRGSPVLQNAIERMLVLRAFPPLDAPIHRQRQHCKQSSTTAGSPPPPPSASLFANEHRRRRRTTSAQHGHTHR